MKELFSKARPLEEYIAGAEEGIQRKIENLHKRAAKVQLSEDKSRYDKVLLISETWCPDCLVLLAALKHLDQIIGPLEIKTLGRDEHMDLLARYSVDGNSRIPLMLILDNEGSEVTYVSEVPDALRHVKKEEKKHRDYRAGKMMEALLNELYSIFLGDKQ